MSLATAATIFYRASVIDAATGREVVALPRKRNLILDAGLDLVATHRWQDCITYAVAGTGNTPTRRDSGAVTFTRAAAIVTASAGFFVAGDAGRILKLNTGEEMKILTYTNATTVTVSVSGTLAASAGTIWYTNQTGLDTEVTRTNTYGNAGGDNATTLDIPNTRLTQRRTFVFPPESGPVTYREVGWSYTPTPGANLFGRDPLAGAGLTLAAGQQLKIVLDLVLTLELLSPEAANTLPWSGGTATQQLENIAWDAGFNPSEHAALAAFVSDGSAAFVAPRITEGTTNAAALTGTFAYLALTAAPYVPGTYTRDLSALFTLNDGNSTALRSFGLGFWWYAIFPVVRVLCSAAQTKDSDNSLRLDFRHTWARVLTN